jgi:UDP:flavonoid glycosyltransferase YjiC (YdhE family)
MVALGRALACRDIAVTIVALRDYAELVTSAGLDCTPIDRRAAGHADQGPHR